MESGKWKVESGKMGEGRADVRFRRSGVSCQNSEILNLNQAAGERRGRSRERVTRSAARLCGGKRTLGKGE